MNSGVELYQQMQKLLDKIDKAIDVLADNGIKLAEAERVYKIALAKKILILREEGQSITLAQDLARGSEDVAKLRFDRDVAQSRYDANKEAIMAWKMQAKILDEQMGREWTRGG